ncbi:cell envelope integrity protein TolA [Roseovarius sp. EL26]|uniref:cell envelope integrity protein TolA n=1 Tax=Roseovarius sp. EL26 TaxID=2126672 RepID=UPI000EA17DB4|nr:cell envelope integrity protein TolA [Roseovarius sp. EL26]
MMRRSVFVAAVAVLLSLLVHGLGLNFTTPELQQQSVENGASDLADVGGSFEDFAEAATVTKPEAVQTPDPPSVTPPEPVIEEAPTSQALVASDNPQDVMAPDTGTGEATKPDVIEPSESETSADDSAGPSGGEDDTNSDVAALQPDEIDNVTEVPEGTADGSIAPAEALTSEAVSEPSPTPETPDEQEVLEPVLPEVTVASAPDDPETLATEDADILSKSAVKTSVRPPKARPLGAALGQSGGAQKSGSVGVIESPLAAYKRGGADPFAGRRSGQSQGTGFSGSRNSGNASITNYAGRVLMQLNRSPILYASSQGTAQVSFEINPDGTLAWVRVLRSTGSPDIDRAASAQVRSAAPFPPPPGGASKRMSFVYRNRR